MLSTQVAYICVCIAWYVMVQKENRKRNRAQSHDGTISDLNDEDARARIVAGLKDETDKRNPYFRYLS